SHFRDCIDEQFLRDFAAAVPLGYLVLREKGFHSLLRPSRDFAAVLTTFKDFEMTRLFTCVDWVLPAVVERLRREVDGYWIVMMDRDITRADLMNLRVPGLEVS
ncbi:hypothetical protein PENTCL1PPCAC_3758, partial [Pristionchus entomophagus]